MDKDFTRDSFERLLKEKSDEFRMYPSNRVWNSIYNNFHPSRKWPSVAMSIALISALMVIGYLNTDSKHTAVTTVKSTKSTHKYLLADNPVSKNQKDEGIATTASIKAVSNTTPVSFSKANTVVSQSSQRNMAATTTSTGNRAALLSVNNISLKDNYINAAGILENSTTSPAYNNHSSATYDNDLLSPVKLTPTEIFKLDFEIAKNTVTGTEAGLQQIKLLQASISSALHENKSAASTSQNAGGLTTEQKSWIENYALHHKPVAKKWKGKLAWQAYFTPSVVYRNLYSNINEKNADNYYGLTGRLFYADPSNLVVHKPSFGLEAGAGLQYNLVKWAKLRTGVQLNYARYSIMAFENDHPLSTTITMMDESSGFPYEVVRSSKYSNLYGIQRVKLHNQTFQLSIPIGVDIRIGKYENIELYAAGSVQPGVVLGGQSYLISSDRLNYVSDNSMLRRFNVNTAMEIYVSYKTSSGYTWQLGPQYRNQLFSTNSKYYSTGEKMLNYGFKLGVSKKL